MAAKVKMSRQAFRQLRHDAGFASDESLRRKLGIKQLWEKGSVRVLVAAYLQNCIAVHKLHVLVVSPGGGGGGGGAEVLSRLRKHGLFVTNIAQRFGVSRSCLSKWMDGTVQFPQWFVVSAHLLADTLDIAHNEKSRPTFQ